ncbi:MAG: YidC/Oxa1 family membrane protein insertase, partial [Chloroflexota bacterium]
VSGYNEGLNTWLFPFVDGAPPIGWGAAIAYLILPILLVVSQLYMQQMMTPPTDDPQQASMQSVMKIMPLMFGYFALIVPSGLSLYWFVSNLLAMAQQYFTKTNLTTSPAPAAGAAVAGTPAGTVNPVPADDSKEEKEEKIDKDAKSKRRRSRRKR